MIHACRFSFLIAKGIPSWKLETNSSRYGYPFKGADLAI